jgi:HSP20 family protein
MSPCSVNTDLKEEHDHLLLNIDLPGVDPNNIEITIDNNILTIK